MQGQADGYAAMPALGQDGTTGGAGGETVTVTIAEAFLDAATRQGPLVIQVDGMLDLPGPTHDVTSDKTIIGLGAGSGFTGGGLNIGLPIDDDITEPSDNAVHNVILQNLNFSGWADDAINVQMFSHHIWIDHNTFVNTGEEVPATVTASAGAGNLAGDVPSIVTAGAGPQPHPATS